MTINLVSDDGTINTNQWHTVVIQYNKNTLAVTMDIDGTVKSGTMNPAMTDRVSTTNEIGKAFWNTAGSSGDYFDGDIAGFYAWDHYLSATEVELIKARISIGGTDSVATGVENAITGTMTTYTAPQVVVQYHAIACPPASDEPTFTGTGNVTFLLAKGNVTIGDITDTLQSTIKTDVATALGITEPDRVFIDHVKASPRRDKEVNMVVHVEHDDTDRDTIAGQTNEVAAAVKATLNDSGLNVCGCNAASLVNQQVQTSITC